MKYLVYLLGLGVLGYAAYKAVCEHSELNSPDGKIQDPIINPTLQTQPQQMFPLQAVIPPRVDNADQPWYSGSRGFFGESNSDFMPDLGSTEGVELMSYNTNSFWTSLESKYFH